MKTRIVLASIVFTAIACGAVFAVMKAGKVEAALEDKKESVALFGTLEGFEPGSKVTYSIFPEKGGSLKGTKVVGDDGKLSIPGYNMRGAAGSYLAYDLEVRDMDAGKDPLNMRSVLNAETHKISVRGKGLEEFSDIRLNSPSVDEKTKADWAGIFNDPEAGNFGDIDSREGFRVALFDNNIMSDVPEQNPRIIKVLAAPGGGLIIDPALNTYFFPFGCNDGQNPTVDYSFCDRNRMDAQIALIVDNYVTALYMMGEQLSAVMLAQMTPVGVLIDAKQQLEAQREMQRLSAVARKDYHPSEMMCEFGSYIKSISTSEEKADYEKQAMNKAFMDFYRNAQSASGGDGYYADVNSRMDQFRKVFCDPNDNNNGLLYMCNWDQVNFTGAIGAPDPNRMNKDIDYQRTMDSKLTLDINFAANAIPPTPDEEDVLALGKNLYWSRVLTGITSTDLLDKGRQYLNARHLMAISNVAHNSYITLAGMKAGTEPNPLGANSGPAFMKSMMRNFGISDPDIHESLGDNPSYYAQMEFLTKKLYQHPDFYTNLIDKPVNVKRIGATMEAVKVMQERDMYESALRREMLTSLMVQEELVKEMYWIHGRILAGTGFPFR